MRWTVPVGEWRGETAFVVAGGNSVSDVDLGLLRGRRVVAVNTSYLAYPNADYLVFGDPRWWLWHRSRPEIQNFKGRVVGVCGVSDHARDRKRLLLLGRHPTTGLSSDPTRLSIQRTTVTAAINLLVLLGVVGIGLLGVDGKASGGRTHHHEPHKRRNNPVGWERHAIDFELFAPILRSLGVEVYNCFADSAHKMFPHASLEELLARWPAR